MAIAEDEDRLAGISVERETEVLRLNEPTHGNELQSAKLLGRIEKL